MKRILEVFGEPIISGGQEAFVNNLVSNIDISGLLIDLYTPYYCGNEYYKKNVLKLGGNVFEENIPFTPGKSRKNIIKPFEKHLKSFHYDVVHVHSGSVSVLAYVAKTAKKCGVNRIIVHSHSPAEKETLKHIAIKILTKRTMQKCPTDFFACSVNAAEWKYPKNIVKNNITIIKNGINLERYVFDANVRSEIRNNLNIPEDAYVVGHVGRFSHEKNHKFLISVFAKLKKVINNAKLILAGDGDTIEEIKALVKEKEIEDCVSFLGNIPNVNEVMQAMDVFVLPSLYEGLPIVGVEAQAAGLAVIVSANVSDELKLTNSIQYVSIEDEQLWVNALVRIADEKPRYQNTEKLAKAGFDIHATAELVRSVYIKE